MSVIHGKATKIYMAEFDLSAVLSEIEVTSEFGEAEDTAFTDTAKSFLIGFRSGELKAKGQWDGAVGKTDVRFNTQMNGTKVPVTIVWSGTTPADATAVSAAGGNMAETKYNTGGGVGDIVPVDISGRLDGGAAFGYCLCLDKAFTSTGDGADVDFGVATGSGTFYYLANLHCTAVTSGSGTNTFLVKGGTDGVTYGNTITTFSNIAAVGSECKTGTNATSWRFAQITCTALASTSMTMTAMLARMS